MNIKCYHAGRTIICLLKRRVLHKSFHAVKWVSLSKHRCKQYCTCTLIASFKCFKDLPQKFPIRAVTGPIKGTRDDDSSHLTYINKYSAGNMKFQLSSFGFV